MKKKSLLPKSSIVIDRDVHRRLKVYCDKNGIKINYFVEKIILEKIS